MHRGAPRLELESPGGGRLPLNLLPPLLRQYCVDLGERPRPKKAAVRRQPRRVRRLQNAVLGCVDQLRFVLGLFAPKNKHDARATAAQGLDGGVGESLEESRSFVRLFIRSSIHPSIDPPPTPFSGANSAAWPARSARRLEAALPEPPSCSGRRGERWECPSRCGAP